MIKLTSEYLEYKIVVEAEHQDKDIVTVTSWINGFTFKRQTHGTGTQDPEYAKLIMDAEMRSIKYALLKEAIVRHTFIDHNGDLQYWQKCRNFDQLNKPGFKAIYQEEAWS